MEFRHLGCCSSLKFHYFRCIKPSINWRNDSLLLGGKWWLLFKSWFLEPTKYKWQDVAAASIKKESRTNNLRSRRSDYYRKGNDWEIQIGREREKQSKRYELKEIERKRERERERERERCPFLCVWMITRYFQINGIVIVCKAGSCCWIKKCERLKWSQKHNR